MQGIEPSRPGMATAEQAPEAMLAALTARFVPYREAATDHSEPHAAVG